MFQWATDQFDKLTEVMAPPPTDAAGRFSYAVTREDESTAMGCIAEIDPVRTIVQQSKGWFPIHMACQYSMLRLIRLLMNQPGISIQQPDYAGMTPLHHACMSTQKSMGLEVVKILLQEYSADPCVKNSQGQTLVFYIHCLLLFITTVPCKKIGVAEFRQKWRRDTVQRDPEWRQ